MKKLMAAAFFVILAFPLVLNAQAFILPINSFSNGQTLETVLQVKEYGRYGILSKSRSGSAFTFVDRILGPSTFGSTGSTDGRADVLLEEGFYKIRVKPSIKDGGADILVTNYRELNTPDAPILFPEALIERELRDFEQASYWIEMKETAQVVITAEGRALNDLRIWKDGSWLLDARPDIRMQETAAGTPWRFMGIITRLDKGLYRVTAYGGRPLDWSENSSSHPFRLRYGIRRLAPNIQLRDIIGPSGVNRYLVQGGVAALYLTAPKSDNYRVEAFSLDSSRRDFSYYWYGTMATNSRLPEVRVSVSSSSGTPLIISVIGQPGKPFSLQAMERIRSYSFRPEDGGSYWLSTVHSGYPGDSLDASGLVVDMKTREIMAKSMHALSGSTPWVRRFNLTGQQTAYFDVTEAGRYRIETGGTAVRYRIEPFFLSYPNNYKSPPLTNKPLDAELAKGVYVLTLVPDKAGILDVNIRKSDFVNFGAWLDSGKPEVLLSKEIRPNVQFPSLSFSDDRDYRFFFNEQGRLVEKGLQLLRLPVDIAGGISMAVRSGEKVGLQFKLETDSVLDWKTADAAPLVVSVDGKDVSALRSQVNAGTHKLEVLNKGKESIFVSISALGLQELPNRNPVYLSTAQKSTLPVFRAVTNDIPVFLDITRNGSETFLLRVNRGGIYTVETTGLLRTSGTIRSRIRPLIATASENGTGRNFVLRAYLQEGVYQLTVKVNGSSEGRLGVIARYDEPVDGGFLEPGVPSRRTVEADSALLYRFRIPALSNYNLVSTGMERGFTCRLEDSEGWPLAAPGISAAFEDREFEKGEYRLILLPLSFQTRRITTLEAVAMPSVFEGKGPHPIELNGPYEYVYEETVSNGVKVPDMYTFELTAPAPLNIKLSDGFYAVISRQVGKILEPAGESYPDRPFTNRLAMGRYRLDIQPLRPDTGVSYEFGVYTRVILPGSMTDISSGMFYTLSAGKAGLYTISTTGPVDTRAWLLDAGTNVLDFSDDAPDDWNFRITRYLLPGEYYILARTRGDSSESRLQFNEIVSRRMETPSARDKKTLDIRNNRAILSFPANGGFFRVTVRAQSAIGLDILSPDKPGSQLLDSVSGPSISRVVYAAPGAKTEMAVYPVDPAVTSAEFMIEPAVFQSETLSGLLARGTGGVGGSALDLDKNISLVLSPGQTADYALVKDGGKESVVFSTAGSTPLSAGAGRVYIISDKPCRFTLLQQKPNTRSAGVELKDNRPVWVDLPVNPGYLTLYAARGPSGIPVMAAMADNSPPVEDYPGGRRLPFLLDRAGAVSPAFSMEEGSVMTAALVSGRAGVWMPLAEPRETLAALERYDFNKGPEQALLLEKSGSIPAGSGAFYSLDPGIKQLRAVIDPGMALVLFSGSQVLSVIHADSSAKDILVWSQARSAAVLSYKGGGRFLLRQVRGTPPAAASRTVYIETSSDNGSETWIAPSASLSAELRVISAGRCHVLTTDGIYRTGSGSMVVSLAGNGAWVRLEPSGRPSKVWVEESRVTAAADRYGAPQGKEDAAIDRSQIFSVEARSVWAGINASMDMVLTVRAPSGFSASVWKDNQAFSAVESFDGSPVCALIKKGSWKAGVRALYSENPFGRNAPVSFELSVPLPITNTVNPEVRIGAWSSAAFSISVDSERSVGIGYDGVSDGLSVLLFDSSGRLIAEGPVLFRRIKPGSYTIVYKNAYPEAASIAPVFVGAVSYEKLVLLEKARELLSRVGYKGESNE